MLKLDGQNQNSTSTFSDHDIQSPIHNQKLENCSFHKCCSVENFTLGMKLNTEKSRFCFSNDTAKAEHNFISRSPVMAEHEHGLGPSGLLRIRQHPPSCSSSLQNSRPTSRRTSMKLQLHDDHMESTPVISGPPSPTSNFTEDLTRFPSESLYSFSFAQKPAEFFHSRQSILKRSIEFMSQNLGWRNKYVGIGCANARLSGDHETQEILQLLDKTQLVKITDMTRDGRSCQVGPLTGPASTEGAHNIFDTSFVNDYSHEILKSSQEPSIESAPGIRLFSTEEKNIPKTLTSDNNDPVLVPELETVTHPGTLFQQNRIISRGSPFITHKSSFRRTYTDIDRLYLQNKLMDALAQPDVMDDAHQEYRIPTSASLYPSSISVPYLLEPVVHGHSSRWAQATQAIFTSESVAPFTILSANDLACLVFGVTKAEVRKMGVLELIQEEHRAWLMKKLEFPGHLQDSEFHDTSKSVPEKQTQCFSPSFVSSLLNGRPGVTASLLSKPNSRQIQSKTLKAQNNDRSSPNLALKSHETINGESRSRKKSRGVLLCGDVVPIQKRNGTIGSASLWVKEKRGSLVWVLEEVQEYVATLGLDHDAKVSKIIGSSDSIWGEDTVHIGSKIDELLPKISRTGTDGRSGILDHTEVREKKYFTARNSDQVNIPCLVETLPGSTELRISSFPYIAGVLVLSAQTLKITSSNYAFSAALFGHVSVNGKPITDIIPDFDRILKTLIEKDGIEFVDGIIIPEHNFRRAQKFLALQDSIQESTSNLSRRDGLVARHRDGNEIIIDAQLRVVKSNSKFQASFYELPRSQDVENMTTSTELFYALWISYSRSIQLSHSKSDYTLPDISKVQSSTCQTISGQTEILNPIKIKKYEEENMSPDLSNHMRETREIEHTSSDDSPKFVPSLSNIQQIASSEVSTSVHKKTLDDFVILDEMGQGAYGQVKLVRYKKDINRKMVIKYVTKRRILIDTWTRDRRLGTVPLEIHVLDFLRRDGLQHPNIIEMTDFFEDDINYYIETVPHGLPGMDLFDYIELKNNIGENECRSIFVQVARAIFHLHTKASVVHRDIKDENVVLDGEGNIKLIDFGSAAYIKNGPFNVFVGTIDYAAPEVLAGKPYRGKEQDVWALGILLYTIVYKENPFYSMDEIMDCDLRIPHIMNEENLDLIRAMLNRDVDSRITIEEVLEHPWCKTMKDA